jgi:polyhydroxybutyrate depolymerase
MEGVAIIMTVCGRRPGRFSRVGGKLALMLCLSLLAPCGLVAESLIPGSLKVDGANRTYLLHVPAGYQSGKPLPLVLAFHGAEMTAELMADVTQLNHWADTTGFIVAYPQGLEKHWNTGPEAAGGPNDIAFITALISNIESTYTIDPKRVMAAGISNGAEFAQELGCSRDLRFSAILAVSATLQEEAVKHCLPNHPVRMIEIHGTEDPIVPYPGGRVAAPGSPVLISVADDLLLWARIDGCSSEPHLEQLPDRGNDSTHVERITFKGCAAGSGVTHYRIVGGGHTWPGSSPGPKFLGRTTQQFSASELLAQIVLAPAKN